MPTNFPCPSCGKYLAVPDQLLGQLVRCGGCNSTFVAGAAGTPPAPVPAMPPYQTPPQHSQGRLSQEQAYDRDDSPVSAPGAYPERWSPVDEDADDYEDQPFRRGSRPTGGKATAAKVFLFLTVVASAGLIAVDVAEINFLGRLQKGIEPGQVERDRLVLISVVARIIFAIMYLGTVITVGMWIYQTHKNLNSLVSGKRDFSPGWAVGWFFIPIANLFKPFQAMRELWKASDPAGSPHAWKQNPSSALIGWWWAFWLLSNIIGNASTQASFRNNATLEDLRTAAGAGMASSFFAILAAFCLIAIIHAVQARQEKKYQLLQEGEAEASYY
jgi:hypothetical protein